MTAISLDLESALLDSEWRRQLSWPLTPHEQRRLARWPLEVLADAIGRTSGRERSVLLLGGPFIASLARELLDAASAIDAARRLGCVPVARSHISVAIGGDAAAAAAIQARSVKLGHEAIPPYRHLRRAARIRSWTPPGRMVWAAVKPDALAISHNSLMVSEAKRSSKAIGFDYGSHILSAARRKAGRSAQSARSFATPDCAALAGAMTHDQALDPETQAAVRDILEQAAGTILAQAARDLDALASIKFGAPAVWSATGGAYPSRAVGLAALEQGLAVRRHEHVGTGCLIADRLGLDMTERAVASEFLVATPDLARFAREAETAPLAPLASLLVGHGDPDFMFPPEPNRVGSRPRVVYSTTLLRGARQYHNAILPDLVYLDWQMRVAAALAGAPLDLIVKPHPSTRYPNGRDPLSDVAPVSQERFESLIPSTDVFVFDFGQTTTFWKGLATAQPLVYLDLGMTEFLPEVRAALETRATVIPVAYDERNLPILDGRLLVAAVMSAKPVTGDNPFRRWLGGDGML